MGRGRIAFFVLSEGFGRPGGKLLTLDQIGLFCQTRHGRVAEAVGIKLLHFRIGKQLTEAQGLFRALAAFPLILPLRMSIRVPVKGRPSRRQRPAMMNSGEAEMTKPPSGSLARIQPGISS